MWFIIFSVLMCSLLSHTSEHDHTFPEISVSTEDGFQYIFTVQKAEIQLSLDMLCKTSIHLQNHVSKVYKLANLFVRDEENTKQQLQASIDQQIGDEIACALNNPPEHRAGAWYLLNALSGKTSSNITHQLQAVLKTRQLGLPNRREFVLSECAQTLLSPEQQNYFLENPVAFTAQLKPDLDTEDAATLKKLILRNYAPKSLFSLNQKDSPLSELYTQDSVSLPKVLLIRHIAKEIQGNKKSTIFTELPKVTHCAWFATLPPSVYAALGVNLTTNRSILYTGKCIRECYAEKIKADKHA